jgi:hypothetical protein
MFPTCAITAGDVLVNATSILCGGQPVPNATTGLTVTGLSTTATISISGRRQFTIELRDVTLTSTAPFTAYGNTVNIITTGISTLISTDASVPALTCANQSTLNFYTLSNGTLITTGGAETVGIGPPLNGRCQTLTILNGTFKSTGIGAGVANRGDNIVNRIEIVNGVIDSSNAAGAGIGAGWAVTGTSRVRNLTILDGEITATGGLGAGIGAGQGVNGTSIVETLIIVTGNLTATSQSDAAAIGSGLGRSSVQTMLVQRGNYVVTGGVGFGNTGSGTVNQLTFRETVTAEGWIDCWPRDDACVNATEILMHGADLQAMTNSSRFFAHNIASRDW